MAESTKVNGKTILKKVKAIKNLIMAQSIMVHISKVIYLLYSR